MPSFLATSNLQRKVTSHLIGPFNEMTTFFFRRSVEKAFQLDEAPSDLTLNPTKPLGSNPPFITSAVDDVMYIVNQVLQRSLATSQRAVVSSVVPTVSSILGSDFITMIQRKTRAIQSLSYKADCLRKTKSLLFCYFVTISTLPTTT
jgi:hypothetical protein